MAIRRTPDEYRAWVGDRRYLSIKQAAQHLGVHRTTIHDWIKRRGLPAHDVAATRRIELSKLEAWWAGSERGTE